MAPHGRRRRPHRRRLRQAGVAMHLRRAGRRRQPRSDRRGRPRRPAVRADRHRDRRRNRGHGAGRGHRPSGCVPDDARARRGVGRQRRRVRVSRTRADLRVHRQTCRSPPSAASSTSGSITPRCSLRCNIVRDAGSPDEPTRSCARPSIVDDGCRRGRCISTAPADVRVRLRSAAGDRWHEPAPDGHG